MAPHNRIAFIFLLGLFSAALAGEECLITTDGRLIRGGIRTVGSALKVESTAPRRDIYISPALVAERKIDSTNKEPEPVFVFNSELIIGKKKGTIAPVVEGFKWGTWQSDGTATVSLRDPGLGAVEYQVAITRVTPEQVELRGVEYEWVRTFTTANMEGLVLPLVHAQTNHAPSADKWLKVAAFHRLRGNRELAEQALFAALELGASHEACATERAKLEQDGFVRTLAALEHKQGTALAESALMEAAVLEIPPGFQAANPTLYDLVSKRLAVFKQRAERHREIYAALSKRNLMFSSLTPDQLERLERVLKQGPDSVDQKWIPELCKEWAEALTQSKWDGALLQETLRLAAQIETYFADGELKQTAAVVDALKASKLPLALNLALLRQAARFPEAPADALEGWKQVEYHLPGINHALHYFVSVPATYRPNTATPVLVALHGQTSTAEVMRQFWGKYAAREGWILISPEYIYGRKWGYEFSAEEHQAVIEAVRHAAGSLNIDVDRIFLTGQSQGGHAAWDIGPAHAGVFAAVVPIIGAPFNPEHWPNFKDTSVYAIDGSQDGNAPKLNQRGLEGLARLHVDVTYVEFPGRGHESFSEEYDTVCAWLRTRHRPDCNKVNLVAYRNIERRRRWVEILGTPTPLVERLQGTQRAAFVEGQIKPNNQIEVKTANVTRLRILMPAGQIDLDKPVTVQVNGRPAWRGTLHPDWNLALRESLTRADRSDIFLAEVLLEVR